MQEEIKRESAGIEVRLKSLSLDSFRGFNKLPELIIGERLTIILSENGGGKTTILDAVAGALQAFVNQLVKADFTKPKPFSTKNIKNNSQDALIELKIEGKKMFLFEPEFDILEDNPEAAISSQAIEYDMVVLPESAISVSINKRRCEYKIDGYLADDESDFSFGTYFKNEYREGDFLPVLAYYGCNSIDTDDITSTPLLQDKIFHLYADCLASKRFSFNSFLRWFDYLYKTKHIGNQRHRELDIVTEVIYSIMNNDDQVLFSNLRMDYQLNRDVLVIDKMGVDGDITRVEIDQMSSGEKVMFALAADIAKRLILANPDLMNNLEESPLRGQGMVLIDEIDLHLHPKWQRLILPKLLKLFPNVQFVVTTHSPFVLQSLKPDVTKIVSLSNCTVNKIDNPFLYGRDATSIAFDLQGVNRRIPEMQREINKMYELIDLGQMEEAKQKIEFLSQFLSRFDEDIVKANTLLKFME